MAYLGNAPARSFISFEKQVFTIVNSQTAYTLSHSVVNENDIRLVVNNVVQEPGSGKAYTASGTTLTLSAALVNGTDEMYCVFLGRAIQTVNPPSGSVGTSQLSGALVTPSTLDINGNELILDVDADTSIAADTDDQIDFKTGGTDAATIDSSANLKFNSGFGSVSTAFGCRAWVRFNGTGTAAINGSGNISSLTDQGVGNIDVNFTNNMPDGNYCVSLSLGRGLLSTGAQQFPITVPTSGNVGYFEVASRQCDNDNDTFVVADADQLMASIFR
jgi:hypothetical protein